VRARRILRLHGSLFAHDLAAASGLLRFDAMRLRSDRQPQAATTEARTMETKRFPVTRTDEEWRALLTPEQYRVLRRHGTEPPGSCALNSEKRPGTFSCAGCGQPLFVSKAKFDSGTGWPSFFEPLEGAVETSVDHSYEMIRTEVHCSRCGGHLGHVFEDGPPPTYLRYCINGVALNFQPE
jgi:peptide-methionine (R)-S-oxide reductase